MRGKAHSGRGAAQRARRCRWPIAILVFMAGTAVQADPYALCPAFLPDRPPLDPRPAGTPVEAAADHMRYERDGAIHLQGDAILLRRDQRVAGENLFYHPGTDRFEGSGALWFETPALRLRAERAEYALKARQGVLETVSYWLTDHHASGRAEQVRQSAPDQWQLRDADFSTCPLDDRDWSLHAEQIDLDRTSGRGTARHATLRVGDTPVFYLPWANFPIDDRRQSGFLYPTFGSSSGGGFELSIPYYWNIAPNLDATLAPRLMSRRGPGLDSELRFLHRQGLGKARLDLTPRDQVRKDRRWLADVTHRARWTENLTTDLRLSRVSDRQYLQDFANNLEDSSTDNLETAFRAHYRAGPWQFGLLAQQYQTISPLIDDFDRPYRTLPRLDAAGYWATGSLGRFTTGLRFASSASRFDHPDPARSTGLRLHARPTLEARWRLPYLEVRPRIALDLAHYSLDRASDESRLPERLNRAIPVTSLDARAFLERDHGGRYLGVLEPRLHYLYVPYHDQSDVPVFDSTLATFSFSRLFADNRYTGADRIGDANRLTYALSWSLIDRRNGLETLGLRVAQQYFLEDARVRIDEAPSQRGPSTVIAEASSQIDPRWRASLTTEYDPDRDALGRSLVNLRYRGGEDEIVNMGYAYRPSNTGTGESPDGYRQAELSFAYPASRRWRFIGRLGYSLEDRKMIRSLAGVGYESCCWAARLAAQRYVVNPDRADEQRYRNAVMLQIELKGLGGLGDTGELGRAIPGFRP
ncbi:MAG: LPS-assembly protein LptD [Halothiobacillaceae bacterium]